MRWTRSGISTGRIVGGVPGSTGACRDAWDLVLAEELDSRFRPCSLVGQIPRFRGICP